MVIVFLQYFLMTKEVLTCIKYTIFITGFTLYSSKNVVTKRNTFFLLE